MRRNRYGMSYRPGNNYTVCMRCGFTYRESEMRVEYTGKKVCFKCIDDPPTALSKHRRYR